MKKTVRAIDIGFGTTTVVTEKGASGWNTRTFPSIAAPIEESRTNISDEVFGSTRNVAVKVEGSAYEVGEDVLSKVDPKSVRVLNSNYIDSDQYRALALGSLAMMNLDESSNTIDMLVCSLPVSNMHKKSVLENMLTGEHELNGRVIKVKKTWVIAQPIGGVLAFFKQAGKNELQTLLSESVLLIDVGYLTVDFTVVSRFIASEARSGAVDYGMSKLLSSVENEVGEYFKLDKVNAQTLDSALCEGKLSIFGKKYQFPKSDDYDFTPAISRVTNAAADSVYNVVGDAQDISRIVLIGGPAQIYLESLKKRYPHHEITVLDDHLRAVALGSQYGGLEKCA